MAQQHIDPKALVGQVLVRVRGSSKRHGLRLERYSVGEHLFEAAKGWYAKPAEMAGMLANCLVSPGNPDSAYALEVVTPEDALRIQHRESMPVEPTAAVARGTGGPLPLAHEARTEQDNPYNRAFEQARKARASNARVQEGAPRGAGPAQEEEVVSAGPVDDRTGSVDTAALGEESGAPADEGRDMSVGLLEAAPARVEPAAEPQPKPRGGRRGSK